MAHRMRNHALIKDAADKVAPLWPLQNYVAVNPLESFADDFYTTLSGLSHITGNTLFPQCRVGQEALEQGKICPEILRKTAKKYGYAGKLSAEKSGAMAERTGQLTLSSQSMTKYLSAFFDNIQADWCAPDKNSGLFSWWKKGAAKDSRFANRSYVESLSDDPADVIVELLQDVNLDYWQKTIELHLHNLKGWASYIRWYEESNLYHDHPADLVDFLAISLVTHNVFQEDVIVCENLKEGIEGKIWLEAWEETFRIRLIEKMEQKDARSSRSERADGQLVFCIDVRSEPLRRHIEQLGNYETFGFAGFFGIPVVAEDPLGREKEITPALLKPVHKVSIVPKDTDRDHVSGLKLGCDMKQAYERFKRDLVTSLGCVELTGLYYGVLAAAKTCLPQLSDKRRKSQHDLRKLDLIYETSEGIQGSLTHEQQVSYANNFLNSIGLRKGFARTIIISGHESETRNNHYASKLDCGACGANSGGVSSMLMAKILNTPEVRHALVNDGIEIPVDTFFYPAVHNTTTDEVRFLSDDSFGNLEGDLKEAQRKCQKEKKLLLPIARHNHLDWSQTQPEWGLARNGAFIIGPRDLTQGVMLEGRCFLHSYDHTQDADGDVLASILAAPVRVAQMINAQYYFSTVDNDFFGAGTKINHNIVGGFGVVQGNGSDLKIGLPLQSVQYAEGENFHEPIRLQVFVHAPCHMINSAINRSKDVKALCDNYWVRLIAVEPGTGRYSLYTKGGEWEPFYGAEGQQPSDTVVQHVAA